MAPVTVIAMTREIGSRGTEVAVGLANALGLKIVDSEIVANHVAERLGLGENAVQRYVEGSASLFEGWQINKRKLSRYTSEEILELCQQGNVLIRGWGAAALFRDLAIARADGSLRTLLAKLSRIDVLVIDDWAMAPLAETERRDFWEICEDRYQTRSTVLTSQLPVSRWHEQIGDPTIADGTLDRLVHNAHRIEMRGESLRKKRNLPQDEKKE